MRHGPMDWTVGTLGTDWPTGWTSGTAPQPRDVVRNRTGAGLRRWHGRDVHKSPGRGVVIVAPGNARGRYDDLKSALEGHLNSHSARTY